MQTIDFQKSFLTFRNDLEKKPPKTISNKPPYTLNNARIQLECRLSITERATAARQTFVMGASCKTEVVGVEHDIWTEPNADFVPIFSDDRFLLLKTFARCGTTVELYPPGSGTQPDRQSGVIAETFDRVTIRVAECAGTVLETAAAVIEAAFANRPIVAVTEIEQERYTALIEYPVKTLNVNERDGIYQTDTGPLLFPDLSRDPAELLDGLETAFSAFNCSEWIEFLIRVPTEIGEGVQVYHYSKPIHLTATNRLVALPAR